MRPLLSLLFLSSVWLGISSTTLAQTAAGIKTIEIHSKWGGFGPAGESRLRLERHKEEFRAGGKRMPNSLVEQLVNEISAPVQEPSLQNLGITESWLQSNAERVIPETLRDAPQNERDLFLNSFRDLRLIERLLPKILSQGWTDDYPQIEIRLVEEDGGTILIESRNQNIFMTPFVITENGSVRLTYNANLSRALARLLPASFTNRERLDGARLSVEVAEKVMTYLQHDLEVLETINKLGPELKQLEGRYTVQETAIGRLSSVDVGSPEEKFPRWNVKLRRSDLPENVIIGLSLPYENNRLVNFDVFLSKIDAIVALPMSVPWLREYLSEHPETSMEIRFVTDRSMSPEAVDYFAETLKTLKAETLAAHVIASIEAVSFVELRSGSLWSRWVVLPDRSMVLFDVQGDRVLRWEVDDFETHTRYDTKLWHMAKAVITPQGEIESR